MENHRDTQLDSDTFAQLFESARPVLRVVAGSECGFEHADDIVQHGAVVALEQLERFAPGTNFTAWSATIIKGLARNHRKTRKRRKSHQPQIARTKANAAGSEESTLVSAGSLQELKVPIALDASIRSALEELKPIQRTCLLLKSLTNHSYTEIAAILDIPAATARSHVYRARTQLLNTLGPSMKNGGDHD